MCRRMRTQWHWSEHMFIQHNPFRCDNRHPQRTVDCLATIRFHVLLAYR